MAGAARFAGWTAGAACLLTGVAACGGDSAPSAGERRAAEAKWVQHVDAACTKANEAIAERGWPVDLVDLDRLVVRGIDDARGAITAIGEEPLPEDGGPAPGVFVREMKALDPELSKLSEASEDLEPAALVKAAEALKPRLATIEEAAADAGLSDCLSHDERFFVPDAVRAPVFAEQLARLDRSLLRQIKTIDFTAAESPGALADAFERYSEVVNSALEGIDKLDPPQWAAAQTAAYQVALRDLQSVSTEYSATLEADRQKPATEVNLAKYAQMDKELNRAGRAEVTTRKKMLRALGAAPTTGPQGGGEAPEDETEQVS